MDNRPENIRVQGQETDEDAEQQGDTVDQQLSSLPGVEAQKLDTETDFGELDPDSLDPNMDYRWIHNSPGKITKRLRRGWTFVRKSEDDVRKLFETQGEGAEDFIIDGDRVLMKIQKELHEIQKQRVSMVTRARLAAPKGQFRKKAKQAGYEVAGRKYRSEPS